MYGRDYSDSLYDSYEKSKGVVNSPRLHERQQQQHRLQGMQGSPCFCSAGSLFQLIDIENHQPSSTTLFHVPDSHLNAASGHKCHLQVNNQVTRPK